MLHAGRFGENALVVYFRAPRVRTQLQSYKPEFNDLLNLRAASMRDPKKRDDYRKERNRLVCRALVDSLLNCVDAQKKPGGTERFLTELFELPSVGLTFVVDEAGDKETELVVEAMSQIEFSDVVTCLRNSRKNKIPGSAAPPMQVRLIVGGTGVGCTERPPGSLKELYDVVTVGLNEDQSMELLRHHLSEGMKSYATELIDFINSEPLLQAACCNARMAVMAAVAANRDSLWWGWVFQSAGCVVSQRGALYNLFFRAALSYKTNNGICNIKRVDLPGWLSSALRVYFFPANHDVDDDSVQSMTTAFGMLVDRAVWKRSVAADEKELAAVDESKLVAPKSGRYDLPASIVAIVVLLLMGDATFASSASGIELENATQMALSLLIMACRRESELIHLLETGVPTYNRFDDHPIDVSKWSVRMERYPATRSIARGRGVNGNVVEKVIWTPKEIDAPIVVLSRCRAPYADVVALFGGLAILVQCKDISGGEVLTRKQFRDEVAVKMFQLRDEKAVKKFQSTAVRHGDDDRWRCVPTSLDANLREHCGVKYTPGITRCIPVVLYREFAPERGTRTVDGVKAMEMSYSALMSGRLPMLRAPGDCL
jgi:hypothetical protein